MSKPATNRAEGGASAGVIANAHKIVKYKFWQFGKVFHIFTGTDLSGSYYNCRTIVLLLRGLLQGQTAEHITKE
jgi:hypothetical protein